MKKILLFLFLFTSVLYGADEDYVWKIAGFTYIGDSTANRYITDTDSVDFTPDFLISISNGNRHESFITPGLQSVGSHGKFDQYVTDIDSVVYGGFFASSCGDQNIKDEKYHVIAMKLDSVKFEEANYSGNGVDGRQLATTLARNIIWVQKRSGALHGCVGKISTITDHYTLKMEDNLGTSALSMIDSIKTSYFVVDNDPPVNASSTSYTYVAWSDISGLIIQDSLFFNSVGSDTSITGLGFKPILVVAKPNEGIGSTQTTYFKTKYHVGDSCSINKYNSAMVTNAIKSLDADGFTLGDRFGTAKAWYYMAWGEGSEAAASSTRKRSQIIISH